MLCITPTLIHTVKETPNRPISIHVYAYQGQLIMEAGTKTTLHSGPSGIPRNAAPVHLAPSWKQAVMGWRRGQSRWRLVKLGGFGWKDSVLIQRLAQDNQRHQSSIATEATGAAETGGGGESIQPDHEQPGPHMLMVLTTAVLVYKLL